MDLEAIKRFAPEIFERYFGHPETTSYRLALLRRQTPAGAASDRFRFGQVTVDFRSTEMWKADERIELSARCFSLLRFFIEQQGVTLSRQWLLVEVWGYKFVA